MFKSTRARQEHKPTDWDDFMDTLEIESWEKDKSIVQAMAAQPDDAALQEAIRQGVIQGQRSSRRLGRKRVGFGMAAALLGIFLTVTAFTRVSPAFASMLSDIPILSKYVDLISYDSSLRLAAENEFMQPVGVSDEHNGKKLTIPFIMTDGNRLVLYYSLEGEGTTAHSHLINTILSGTNGEELPAGYFWGAGADDGKPVTAKYDKLDIYLGEGTMLPERVKFKGQAEGEDFMFEVEFDIDHSLFQDTKEEFNVDKEFQIGGQMYRVEKLIVTPLQASVMIQGMPGNTKKTHSLRGLALEDEKGRRWTSSNGMGALDAEGIRGNFYSSYFEKPKHLTLVAEGAHQSERGRKLVVDTEKGLTIETPDKRLKLKEIKPAADPDNMKIVFEINQLTEAEGSLMNSLFDQSQPFTDGSGKSYMLVSSVTEGFSAESHQSTGGLGEQFINYVIPKRDYKQPLTFELDQYPGYVDEPIRVPLY